MREGPKQRLDVVNQWANWHFFSDDMFGTNLPTPREMTGGWLHRTRDEPEIYTPVLMMYLEYRRTMPQGFLGRSEMRGTSQEGDCPFRSTVLVRFSINLGIASTDAMKLTAAGNQDWYGALLWLMLSPSSEPGRVEGTFGSYSHRHHFILQNLIP